MIVCFIGNYLVTVAADGWHFLDVNRGTTAEYLQGYSVAESSSAALTCGAFHPDGLILGTGCESGSWKIWDVRTMENPHVLSPPQDKTSPLTCLQFSENGYLTCAGYADGSVRLWDLRKLSFTQSVECKGQRVIWKSFLSPKKW